MSQAFSNKQFQERIKFQYFSIDIGNMLVHGYIFLVGNPRIHSQTELCSGALKPLIFPLWLKQDEGRLREALKFANVCGALTVTQRGAIPALPTRQQVLDALANFVA